MNCKATVCGLFTLHIEEVQEALLAFLGGTQGVNN